MSQWEGCASISNHITGNILFYTDGTKVWNANHVLMTNGTGLTGNNSSAQSAVIVPHPSDSNLYYIFTAGEYFNNGIDGYRYSIVDMTLSGGLGAITATKNVLIYAPASEKLAAIKNASGTGYWITTHEFNTASFIAYELTSSGLSAPVVSAVGTAYSGYNPIGCMKFSPDGTRLATILSGIDQAEFYDFDAATGIISNAVNLGPVTNAVPYVYGISFSPNGTRLYIDEENNSNIFQYDLTAGSVSDINASKTIAGTSTSYSLQAMQIAPDGKLYIARSGASYLAVINDPDSLGTACNFIDNGFYLSGNTSTFGLPAFVENVFNQNVLPQSSFIASDTDLCEKFCIDFFDSSANNPVTWEWHFPGGSPASSANQNPTQICYSAPGTFDVTLITTGPNGSDTLTLSNYITVHPTPPLPSISQTGYTLTSSTASAYQWQFNSVEIPGATNQSYEVTQSGFYTVFITDENGCSSSSTINVLITGIGDVSANADVLIYPNPSDGRFMVEWLNGQMAGEVQIQVYNMLGQIAFSLEEKISLPDWKIEIDLRGRDAMPCVYSNIYLIEISERNTPGNTQDVVTRKKIIILK
jgi:PKD repeat protein